MTSYSLTETWSTLAPPAERVELRRTKIVCTLGPTSTSREQILELATAGMDVARLNFSHGTHAEHLERLAAVRWAQAQVERPIAVLADLCGPKIRIAGLAGPVEVEAGDTIVFCDADDVRPGELGVTFPNLAGVVAAGQELLVDDGRIRTRVVETDDRRVLCTVVTGGTIKPSKGVNLPATSLPIPALTAKDELDLELALRADVDYVALSFVRTAADVRELRTRIDAVRSDARIVAKIEKAEAVANLTEIVEAADAVMVARGDLGVEIGVARVPLVQKQIIAAARSAGRAVITATQMLESMITESEPTRAEASDVANAILDGTSAIMLSAETAAGAHPRRAVEVMDTIARSVEPSLPYERSSVPDTSVASVLTHAACDLADDLDAAVVAVATTTGATARNVARCRPQRPVLAAASSPRVLQQLALEWAVVPVAIPQPTSVEGGWTAMADEAAARGLAGPGDTIVHTGRADAAAGAMTHVSVHRIDAR